MDGGVIRDLLSLKHIYATFQEILFEREGFANKVRTGGFLEITRPVPFVTASLLILAVISKLNGRLSPIAAMSSTTQIEVMLFFFLPFALVFHWGMTQDNRWASVPFGASVSAWLYVFGMLVLLSALAQPIGPYLGFLKQVPVFGLMLLASIILGVTLLVMAPLYEVISFDDFRNTLGVSSFLGVVAFFGSRELFKHFDVNPARWLADSLQSILH